MKIAFLCGDMDRSGGTERACALIANGLARIGHDITIVSVQKGLAPFFELEPRVKLDAIFSTPSRFLKRYPLIIWRLRKKLVKQKFDTLVDVESMLALVSLPAMIGLPIRHICWEHFNFNVDLGKKGRRFARQLAALFCDDILTLTEHDKTLWQKGTWLNARISAIPNPAAFDVQETPYAIDSKLVLAVGRPLYLKGYDLLLQAWGTVSLLADGWTLRIVGCGDEHPALEALCSKLNIHDSVQLVPSTTMIAQHYRDAAIYCLSSRSEGFPMVLIEALCFGLPVVSFDCETGPKEILEDYPEPLVPAGHTAALALALLKSINNPARRLELSALAKARAHQYQSRKVIPRWTALLEQESSRKFTHPQLRATAAASDEHKL